MAEDSENTTPRAQELIQLLVPVRHISKTTLSPCVRVNIQFIQYNKETVYANDFSPLQRQPEDFFFTHRSWMMAVNVTAIAKDGGKL